MIQSYEGNILKSFAELRQEYGIPNKTFYSYLQIRHALGNQFRDHTLEWSKIPLLQKIIKADTTKGLTVYLRYMHKQQAELICRKCPLGSKKDGKQTWGK